MPPTESALIVVISSAEPAVAAARARLDSAADWGVPAHITVLYPFLPPSRIDAGVIAALSAAVATVPVFGVELARIGWFDDSVLWLAPEPAEPFRDLTAAVVAAFPETPPYAGAYPDVVPHLTVGHGPPVAALRAAATAITRHLPIHASVSAVHLYIGAPEPGAWHPLAEFSLAAPASARCNVKSDELGCGHLDHGSLQNRAP